MSLESFYGGKQGISPVIKGSFKYIDENDPAYIAAIAAATPTEGSISSEDKKEIDKETMDLCFLNPNYKDIWYNELCIIDTESKNNSNNGKLYRRTLKGLGNIGTNLCAEYIGQIVGPAGGNPRMEFMSIEDLKEKASSLEIKDNKTISYPGQNNQEPFNPDLLEIFDGSTGNTILVPGKASENKYNDSIKYTWVNFIDDKETEESVVYMGFQIPYTVFDFTAESVSWTQEANIQDNSSNAHPFYKNINIQVPRGVRGNAPLNFKLVNKNSFDSIENPLYDWNSSVQYDESDGRYSFNDNSKSISLNDKTDSIWVYDYIFYDETITQGSKFNIKTFFLGNYKEITGISLNNSTGKMMITFTGSNPTLIPFPSPDELTKNEKGEITLSFKDDDSFNSITIKDGTDNFKLNYIENTKVLGNDIKAHLLVLHSSSYYRVIKETEDGKDNYYYKGKKIEPISESGSTYTNLPKIVFKENSSDSDTLVFIEMNDGKWWQDLGEIGKYSRGIRIKEEISYEGNNEDIGNYISYDDYKNIFSPDHDITFIEFLNLSEWYCYKKTEDTRPSLQKIYYINNNGTYEAETSLGDFDNNKIYYERLEVRNPYYGGRLRSFKQTWNWLDEGLLWANIDGGSAYFYDYFEQTWKLLGRWEDTNSQLVFSDINNDTQVFDTGLILKTIEQPLNLNINLLNIWAQVE